MGWGQYKSSVLTKPTCTINGVQIDTCQICGQEGLFQFLQTVSMYGSKQAEPSLNVPLPVRFIINVKIVMPQRAKPYLRLGIIMLCQTEVKPTCTAAGYIIYRCSTCGATTRVENSATGHTPADDSYVITVDLLVPKAVRLLQLALLAVKHMILCLMHSATIM